MLFPSHAVSTARMLLLHAHTHIHKLTPTQTLTHTMTNQFSSCTLGSASETGVLLQRMARAAAFQDPEASASCHGVEADAGLQ